MTEHGPAGYGSASAPPPAGYGSGGVSEPGDLPRYNTPTGEHPSIIAMRERQEQADAQGYAEGDVNHLVQPIVGRLRLDLRAITEGASVAPNAVYDADTLTYMSERLYQACNAELAYLTQHRALVDGIKALIERSEENPSARFIHPSYLRDLLDPHPLCPIHNTPAERRLSTGAYLCTDPGWARHTWEPLDG
jgi:hypothetical protein